MNTHRAHPLVEVNVIETSGRRRARPSVLVLERLGKERFERSLVRAWVGVAHEDKAVGWIGRRGCRLRLHLGVGVRVGCGFAALVVWCALIRAMHFSLYTRDLVHEGLFTAEVLPVQPVPACLGDRSQPILVRYFHDEGHVSVLVICGNGDAAPPRPRTKHASRCDLVENVMRAYPLHLGMSPSLSR